MTILASILLAVVFAAPPDEELRRGVLNLVYIEDLSNKLRYERAVHGRMTPPVEPIVDPWGTPYRVEIDGGKFRIIGAGSDRKFEPETWAMAGQYADLAIDVVYGDGDTRSNHLWLNRLVPDRMDYTRAVAQALAANPGMPLDLVLTTPRLAGAYLAMIQDNFFYLSPPLIGILQAEKTWTAMQRLAAQLDAGLQSPSPPNDEWGTPLRVELDPAGGYRIIAAGADRTFDPESWVLPMGPSLDEDQVYAAGKGFVRKFDRDAHTRHSFLEKAELSVPKSPEPDGLRTIERAGITAYRAGGGVKAPVSRQKVDVPYPPELRAVKKLGALSAEIIVDEKGKVRDVTVIRSADPAFERAARETMSRWRFRPGTLNGKPVPVLVRIYIEF